MRLFKPLYEMALRWAAHPQAERFLSGLSFIEAFFFPIAPEIMLAPMTLAHPQRWARYASLSLLFSLIGAAIGYGLGYFAFDLLRPLLAYLGWLQTIDALVMQLQPVMADHAWAAFGGLVLAGFLPIPLKFFTWASGIVGIPILAFMASMLIGRGKRVFLVAGAIRFGGKKVEQALHQWIEWIGWALIVIAIALVMYFKFLH